MLYPVWLDQQQGPLRFVVLERLGEGVGLPDVAPVVTAMLAAKVSGQPAQLACCMRMLRAPWR